MSKTCRDIAKHLPDGCPSMLVLPLYASLPYAQQLRVFQGAPKVSVHLSCAAPSLGRMLGYQMHKPLSRGTRRRSPRQGSPAWWEQGELGDRGVGWAEAVGDRWTRGSPKSDIDQPCALATPCSASTGQARQCACTVHTPCVCGLPSGELAGWGSVSCRHGGPERRSDGARGVPGGARGPAHICLFPCSSSSQISLEDGNLPAQC